MSEQRGEGLFRHGARELAYGDNRLADAFGVTLTVHRLRAGERVAPTTKGVETALLVLVGKGKLQAPGLDVAFERKSWVDESPTVMHASAGAELAVLAESDCEIACVQTANTAAFPARAHRASDVPTEHRGQGKAGETAYRLVRTVFDRSSAPKEAKLVIGEVLSFPGKWSSYPPHHHRQPELYYYRFSPEQGYGHAEHGDDVYKVRQHDVLAIAPGQDHAQAAAPGYHMYYLWAIRHLDGDPYTGFEYDPAHRWVFEG